MRMLVIPFKACKNVILLQPCIMHVAFRPCMQPENDNINVLNVSQSKALVLVSMPTLVILGEVL